MYIGRVFGFVPWYFACDTASAIAATTHTFRAVSLMANLHNVDFEPIRVLAVRGEGIGRLDRIEAADRVPQ